MSSHSHIDPDVAERFNTDLRGTRTRVLRRIDSICGEMHMLGRDWRDQQFEEFRMRMQHSKVRLEEFCEYADRLAREVDADIQAARDVQRHR